jgi:hypothetical protein
MDQNPIYQALYRLRSKPVEDSYQRDMEDASSGFANRGLSDSSAAGYQFHLLRKGRQDALDRAQMESQLGTQEQSYQRANLMRQLLGDAQGMQQNYFANRIGNSQNLLGIANTALSPQLMNNQRGFNTQKTGFGDFLDGANDIAGIISKLRGGGGGTPKYSGV